MQNKKSQIEDWLSFLVILFLIIFVVFFLPQQSTAGTRAAREEINLQVISSDSGQVLLNYLRTNLDNNVNVAEAIGIYFDTNDENLLKKIKDTAHEPFSKSYLETDSSSWSLEINYPGKKQLVIEPEKARTDYIIRKEVSVENIPAGFPGRQIELKLFLVQIKYVPK